MVRSLGLTTGFTPLSSKELSRFEKYNLQPIIFDEKKGNGVVISKDWDPEKPTVFFCHGRAGSAGSSLYVSMPLNIQKHRFDDNCNVAIVLHQAPGDQNTMVWDAQQALDHITMHMGDKNVRTQDVHLAGYSIGCITAASMANSNPKAARLTLLLPPTNMSEAVEHTFGNWNLGILSKPASHAMRIVNGNHRSTVDYIAEMHTKASTRGQKDVMPIEALLSLHDKVASPDAFMRGLDCLGMTDAVNVLIKEMQNSDTHHTRAFSLEENFPDLLGDPLLTQPRERIAPIVPTQHMSR